MTVVTVVLVAFVDFGGKMIYERLLQGIVLVPTDGRGVFSPGAFCRLCSPRSRAWLRSRGGVLEEQVELGMVGYEGVRCCLDNGWVCDSG